MRIYWLAAAIASAVLLAGCLFGPSRGGLREARSGFEQVTESQGLAAALGRYAAENAVFLPAGHEAVTGKSAIVEALAQGDMVDVQLSSASEQVRGGGALVSAWGTYVVSQTQQGQSRVGYGKFLAVWQKLDGHWRVVTFVTSRSPGPGIG